MWQELLYLPLFAVVAIVAGILIPVSILGAFCVWKYPSYQKRRKVTTIIWIFLSLIFLVSLLSLLVVISPFEPIMKLDNWNQNDYKNISLRHESVRINFPVGAAINTKLALCDKHIAQWEFTSITPVDSLQWSVISVSEGKYNWKEIDRLVEETSNNSQIFYGHALVSDNYIPDWIIVEFSNKMDNKARAKDILQAHIDTVISHFNQSIDHWHVIDNTDETVNPLKLALGFNYYTEAFSIARKVEPKAHLYMNQKLYDYSLESQQVKSFIQLLQNIKEANISMNGVALELHINSQVSNITELRSLMSIITNLGYRIKISGLDARLRAFIETPWSNQDPFEKQGKFFGDVVLACLENNCESITFWGISDASNWYDTIFSYQINRPNLPLLFDTTGNRKPAWYNIIDILKVFPSQNSTLNPAPLSTNYPSEEVFHCESDNQTPLWGITIKILEIITLLSAFYLVLVVITSIQAQPKFQSEKWHGHSEMVEVEEEEDNLVSDKGIALQETSSTEELKERA